MGSGLDNSTAGDLSTFFVQCRDRHGNAVAIFPSSVLITMGNDRATVEMTVVSVLGFPGLLNVSYQATLAGEYRINITFLTSNVNARSSFRKFVFPGSLDFLITSLMMHTFLHWLKFDSMFLYEVVQIIMF